MRSKLFLVLQIVVPAIMLTVLVLYACFEILSDYSTEEVPDTDSVFVYSVDRELREDVLLNLKIYRRNNL
ncbi:MAG: hypothetical protein IKD91_02670 [Clostridiales bacterium]|nr:hypothetical protein [Clostridiales bacterium]